MKHLAWLGFAVCAVPLCVACAPGVADGDFGGEGGTSNKTGGFNTSTGTGFGTASGMTCETHCSSDLHAVLDCNDTVLKTCPMGTGCSTSGECVDPCQAASENKTTIGCDFYSVTPSVIAESRGSCFATMIANTWDTPVSVQAEYGGQTLNAAPYLYIPSGTGQNVTYTPASGGMLQPGQLGILFLSQYPTGDIFQLPCPVPSALNQLTQVDSTGIGNAFHVTTNGPIVMYDVYPWGGSPSFVSSATLLLPTPTWGTNIVSDDGWEAGIAGQPWTQIVASQDATTITIVPTTTINAGAGVQGAPQNVATTYSLNRGQVLQFVQQERLAGSTISSDKPVSLWGGSTCLNIPSNVAYCDAGHQQLLPVQELGSEYVAVRYPSRGGGDPDMAPYTLVGMVDGTTLTFDPPIGGAPATLNRGQVTTVTTNIPFHIQAQDADHPFYIAAHMTGSQAGSGIGDPETVNVIPPQQYLDKYLFVTDPTYRYTSLVFSRQKGKDGLFHDVTLDCFGPLTGWEPLGSSGQYETIRMYITVNGGNVGNCGNGVHTASSDVPFGLSVWGYDQDVSYGYPAGMSLQPINNVVVPPTPQ